MSANGVDATAMIAQLAANNNDLAAKHSAQVILKTQLKEQTALVEEAKALAYANASQACDRVISAFGRTANESKEAIHLRKALRFHSRASQAGWPTP